jgi:hypothetical protein
MAATVKVYYDWGGTTGTPGTATDVTSVGIRFKTADQGVAATIDTNYPIPVPTSGTNRSMWKHLYLKCTDATGLTKIDNVKFYGGDSAVFTGYTGVKLQVGTVTCVKNSAANTGYVYARGTTSVTGRSMTAATGHTGITYSTSCNNYQSATPLTVPITETSSQIDAANETTNYVVVQLTVADTAASGTLTAESLVFKYDEI